MVTIAKKHNIIYSLSVQPSYASRASVTKQKVNDFASTILAHPVIESIESNP